MWSQSPTATHGTDMRLHFYLVVTPMSDLLTPGLAVGCEFVKHRVCLLFLPPSLMTSCPLQQLDRATSDAAATCSVALPLPRFLTHVSRFARRLLSDLPTPSVGVLHNPASTPALAVARLLGKGSTLVTYDGAKLPSTVEYAGAARKPKKWAEYLKEKGISAKSL